MDCLKINLSIYYLIYLILNILRLYENDLKKIILNYLIIFEKSNYIRLDLMNILIFKNILG